MSITINKKISTPRHVKIKLKKAKDFQENLESWGRNEAGSR
jgi:hypothetical protein